MAKRWERHCGDAKDPAVKGILSEQARPPDNRTGQAYSARPPAGKGRGRRGCSTRCSCCSCTNCSKSTCDDGDAAADGGGLAWPSNSRIILYE